MPHQPKHPTLTTLCTAVLLAGCAAREARVPADRLPACGSVWVVGLPAPSEACIVAGQRVVPVPVACRDGRRLVVGPGGLVAVVGGRVEAAGDLVELVGECTR